MTDPTVTARWWGSSAGHTRAHTHTRITRIQGAVGLHVDNPYFKLCPEGCTSLLSYIKGKPHMFSSYSNEEWICFGYRKK